MILKFSSFMANVNPNIKNETKSDIYIFKSDAIYYFIKKYSSVLMTSKLLSFITKSEPNHWKWNKIRQLHIQIWRHIYFSDFQNRSFSVLWLKWTEAMEVNQNQIFFHGTYSNLTLHLFLSNNNKVFQWLSKSKFLSFMTNVKPNNGSETKISYFSRGHI